MDADDEQPAGSPQPVSSDIDPAEDEESNELELGDPKIDEAELPELDLEDAEALGEEHRYDDLIDRRWLERGAGDDDDDDRSSMDEVGLTIDLDELASEDDGAQIVDLDVGSLLTPLPSDAVELELDPGPARDRAALALGALRDMLLPEGEEADQDDHDVGDDDRFPVFDDSSDSVSSEIPARPAEELDADAGPEDLA
jgi:hypothetical protein